MPTSNLCIIPARGGSKRIPRKNIKEFKGKPIIAYSITAAIESGLFDEVVVSTDDLEIANIAIKYGAKVPFIRSSVNSNDFATTSDVILEVINNLEELNLFYDNICCIYPTAPLININKLNQGYELLINKNADTVMSIVKFEYPIFRAFELNSLNKLDFIWPEYKDKRSQDITVAYHDAGQWYWLNILNYKKHLSIINSSTYGILLDSTECQDIDNTSDWEIALLKYELLQNIR